MKSFFCLWSLFILLVFASPILFLCISWLISWPGNSWSDVERCSKPLVTFVMWALVYNLKLFAVDLKRTWFHVTFSSTNTLYLSTGSGIRPCLEVPAWSTFPFISLLDITFMFYLHTFVGILKYPLIFHMLFKNCTILIFKLNFLR